MVEPVLVALTGKARSGKSTVARYLVERYGFEERAFGDKLKSFVHQIFELEYDKKYRDIYQKFGQFCRSIDENVWVRHCLYPIIDEIEMKQEIFEEYGVVIEEQLRYVISDLRQLNEYKALREYDFVIIRINASDDVRLARMKREGDVFTPEALNHETERYVDTFDVDYEITNDGSLRQLYEQVDAIMRGLIK